MTVASVANLSIDIVRHGIAERRVVDAVSFDVAPGELLALVGESGSGKTMIARSLLRLLPPAAVVAGGSLRFEGRDLLTLSAEELRGVRGAGIGMVFQDPMASLNPALTVGMQIGEGLRLHTGASAAEARAAALDMLAKVRFRDPQGALDCYPHQFSGGMRQRIMIASVLALRPRLLIADEPTTALDAIVAADVMSLMLDLTRELGTAVLLVSHDLGLVAEHADRVVVLRDGRVVEAGRATDVLRAPSRDYTRALVAALPKRAPAQPRDSAPLVEIDDLRIDFARKRKLFGPRPEPVRAVQGVSFDVRRGETLALVGESGSGKTSVGRALLGLAVPTSGAVRFDATEVASLSGAALRDFRRRAQMIFQDPWSSLDPRLCIGDAIGEALRLLSGLSAAERRDRIAAALTDVALTPDQATRLPHELSGGQRQRVVIARAIIARPDFVVADEPVSALDVTVQHQVLALLTDLRARLGFTMVFISHDLGVVEQIADRVAVMQGGKLVEIGTRDQIFDAPAHDYTRALLAATPRSLGAQRQW